jgi:hypothetical protein
MRYESLEELGLRGGLFWVLSEGKFSLTLNHFEISELNSSLVESKS